MISVNLRLYKKDSARQRRKIMKGTYWIKHSVLAPNAAGALAASAAWITTTVKFALLTTESVSGTAIHVHTILGRITFTVGAFRSGEG
jgi:osmotically-inducible protein OsmY